MATATHENRLAYMLLTVPYLQSTSLPEVPNPQKSLKHAVPEHKADREIVLEDLDLCTRRMRTAKTETERQSESGLHLLNVTLEDAP